MHTFYYKIENDPNNPDSQVERISRVEELAKRYEMKCHKETIKDITTLQVETNDESKAIIFKLAAEPALHFEHS